MKSIVLLLCSLLSYSLIAQPTTLDMKERYYMKGEVSEGDWSGSSNFYSATKTQNNSVVFVGSGISATTNRLLGSIETMFDDGSIKSGSLDNGEKIMDCVPIDEDNVVLLSKSKILLVNTKTNEIKKNLGFSNVIFEKLVYNSDGNSIIAFGLNTKETIRQPYIFLFDSELNTPKSIETSDEPELTINLEKIGAKYSFATTNENTAIWIYESSHQYRYDKAEIALIGKNPSKTSYAYDRIDVQKYVNNFVSDFRPFTSYENKAYEQIYKAQWAISGIHPKEDGKFLITASFVHWTTTSSGKAGYQKGILGVEYDIEQQNSIIETWVVFPWAVKEATGTQEKNEIKPYYTSYIGENDIAVFDQETGHLFAINSDLDACKSTDELGTCGAKSKELQRWLINNRLIAQLENGYFVAFDKDNQPFSPNRTISLLYAKSSGSGFQMVSFSK